MLAAKGYPGKYNTGEKIIISDYSDKNNSYIFHAGTKKSDENLITSGGRVLTVVGTANSISILNFVGNAVLADAAALAGIATITVTAEDPVAMAIALG